MRLFEENYFNLLTRVRAEGELRNSRVGDTISVFGESLTIPDLTIGYFPLLTTRKMTPTGVLGELAAFLRGASDLATFKKFGCNYWDYNAAQWMPNTDVLVAEQQVGRVYGVQWRDWNNEVDQLANLVTGIERDPYGRRHILTAWNPSDLPKGCLPPCHIMSQFYVSKGTQLDCMVYMRSVDLCLGLPSDVVLYAALLCLVAKRTGYAPGVLKFSFGDTHIYANHIKPLQEQLERTPRVGPTYKLKDVSGLFAFQPADFTFENYQHYGAIKYELN